MQDPASRTDTVDSTDGAGAREFRRRGAAGVAVLTTRLHGRFRGITVNAFFVASIDPFQIVVSLDSESQMAQWLPESGLFALATLPWSEQFLADTLSGFAPLAHDSFAGIDHFVAGSGSPVPTRCMSWVDCHTVSAVETGDHTIFVGEVLAWGMGQGSPDDPLLYATSCYRRLAPGRPRIEQAI